MIKIFHLLAFWKFLEAHKVYMIRKILTYNKRGKIVTFQMVKLTFKRKLNKLLKNHTVVDQCRKYIKIIAFIVIKNN